MDQDPVHTKRLEDNISKSMRAADQGQQDKRALEEQRRPEQPKRAKSNEPPDEASARPSRSGR